MRLKTYKMAISILPKFLTLKWNISRTIWRIEVGNGSFFCIFHALSFELNFSFRPDVPFKKRLSEFKASPLLGGWEECLEKDLSVKNKFHGIQLIGRQRLNEIHHALVSDRRDFKAIRNETITSLSNFIEQRCKSDQGSLRKLKPLKKLKENIMDQELKECHQSIIADKSLAEFGLQYKEAASIPELNTAENPTDLLTLLGCVDYCTGKSYCSETTFS